MPDEEAELTTGDTGDEVRRLQERLAELGLFSGTPGGNFLKRTTAAVKAFQKTHRGPDGGRLDIDGIVGERTWWALDQGASAALPQSSDQPVLKYGDKGDAVKVLQRKLTDGGFFDGNIGGNFLERTERAVAYFQQTHLGPDGDFLSVDGVVTADDWWALDHRVGAPQRNHLNPLIPSGLSPARVDLLTKALAEHAAGVAEDPPGSNRGGGVDKYKNHGGAWCCYFVSWVDRQAGGRFVLRDRFGLCYAAYARAKELGLWRDKDDHVPVPGDAFVMLYRESNGKFSRKGHIGFVARVDVRDGRAVRFNTIEGNSGDRVKVGIRKVSQSTLEGYIVMRDDAAANSFEHGVVDAPETALLSDR